MKTSTLTRSIECDLSEGHAAVVQIVSTERRDGAPARQIPTQEWNDIRVDITPREYVLSYLQHSFPGAALRAFHRQRRQSLLPARVPRWATRREP